MSLSLRDEDHSTGWLQMNVLSTVAPEHNDQTGKSTNVKNITFILSKNVHSYHFPSITKILNMLKMPGRYPWSS